MHHSVKRDLYSIALVCQYFSAVVLPWIFEHVELDLYRKDDLSLYSRHASLCRHILEGGNLVATITQQVKTCAINWSDFDDREDTDEEPRNLLTLHSRAIPYMVNIQTLSMHSTPMTNDLFSTVTKLPQLASLSLKYCTLCEDLDHFRLEEFSRLSLKSLTLMFDERFPVKQIHRLRDLLDYVNLRTLTDLSTNCWRLCMRLGDESNPVVLEELEIDLIYDVDILYKLLLRCPALRIFRLTGDSHTVDNRALILPPETLRHLTCVEAPPSVLQGLIPGRPVS
ncbi:hypothetical protein CVT26_005893 [Gymnopilus dilepis]|uniref:F-box domain-containing protein n=1 Tax=Gymnopilus dilepis TaxID=231916 RepID=A0A409Y1K4_9AGAR|nr:hypothetical protein CVT26_005893 [Gymnopilus dilepis]